MLFYKALSVRSSSGFYIRAFIYIENFKKSINIFHVVDNKDESFKNNDCFDKNNNYKKMQESLNALVKNYWYILMVIWS